MVGARGGYDTRAGGESSVSSVGGGATVALGMKGAANDEERRKRGRK